MKILLVGAGGYGVNYIRILLENTSPDITWEGVVDPYFAGHPAKEEVESRGVPVYDTMEEFFAEHTADLTVIATPTFLHCEQSICALAHGSDVLCEKPAAPTTEQAKQMMEAEEKYGHFIAIGYQWSYSATMQKLKTDILNGTFGKPVGCRTIISWPRSRTYYKRGGGWGGKVQKDGKWILDSIASNACAHYLHNMLFLLGDTMETAAEITEFRAECYRANDIENFDTCTFRLNTTSGADLYYAASHACGNTRNPVFEYRFEKADIIYNSDPAEGVVVKFHDGSIRPYGDPNADTFKKFTDCIEAVRTGKRPVCTVRTAYPHVQFIEDLYKSTPIHNFSPEYVYLDEETETVYVDGLFDALNCAYDEEQMLSETCSEII